MSTLNFEGVFPILATSFDDNENLDLESFDRLVRFIGGLGVDGLTILGVLGEANRLLDHERETLIRTAVAAAGFSGATFPRKEKHGHRHYSAP